MSTNPYTNPKINSDYCVRYATWVEFLKQGKNKLSRPIANNTKVIGMPNESIGIKLHDTIIIEILENDSVILNSGGWRIITTKDRINRFAGRGINVWQNKKIWYVICGKRTVPFADGMIITWRGTIKYAGKNPDALLKLDKKAVAYCKKFIELFLAGKIEKPGAGDCFFCSMKDQATGKTLGDSSGMLHSGESHIKSHIKEKYYVPSLLYNAMTDSRALMSMVAKDTVARIWYWKENKLEPYNPKALDHWRDIAKHQIYRSLLRYIRTRLGLAT